MCFLEDVLIKVINWKLPFFSQFINLKMRRKYNVIKEICFSGILCTSDCHHCKLFKDFLCHIKVCQNVLKINFQDWISCWCPVFIWRKIVKISFYLSWNFFCNLNSILQKISGITCRFKRFYKREICKNKPGRMFFLD